MTPAGETIAAVATPFGESGIGIVRISGSSAEAIVRRLFKPKKELAFFVSHHFHYGEIINPRTATPVDEVLLVLMRAPNTYTREDTAEIQCHGGFLVLQEILELVLKEGARLAQPGEFTRRAYLNGRIDLTQAEAVIDLIRARTAASLQIANQQLRGFLSSEMGGLRGKLIEYLALIEAHIDFPEEEIDPISRDGMRKDLEGLIRRMDEWVDSYEEGRIFREGISCAIIGRTNVGKSSLLNVLLKEERAIVTPVPGTTRDVIEDFLNIEGIPVRLMDTAGLRKTSDTVELEGVKKTKQRVADADFVVLTLDGSRAIDADDLEIFREVQGKKKVLAVNKKDLPARISVEDLKQRFPDDPIVPISALRNEGIDRLKIAIHDSLIRRGIRVSSEHTIIGNIRHKNGLINGRESLSNVLRGLEENGPLEIIAFELRSALEALEEIVGKTTTEEVLDRIFEQFCIGK
ncbi:MAG: tRNA uridine-5-carboxymethylaminomethyl(34) synthesis GTPase MnmE [Deltaproteobacteria bacterium RBG_13_52_11b]|nr:MAG: tRNA uridine-5-carboxymethylaminomethyl(34) synthesis GTPase MnmE [Deltaproteobacteria bacterium RBG_13_52_11b]